MSTTNGTKKSTKRPISEWVREIATINVSGELDNMKMEVLLRVMNFPKAKCICGIVYLEGKGTIEYPPMSIHTVAKMILKKLEEDKLKGGGWVAK